MAKELFVAKHFTAAHLDIIAKADKRCSEMRRAGYTLTLRQLYYWFISEDLFPDAWKNAEGTKNNEQNYDKLGSIINDARYAGKIDWAAIEDRGRDVSSPYWYDGPQDVLNAAANGFRLERWKGQKNYCMVMVEKEALMGIVSPVCRRLDIDCTANKGYASASHFYSIGKKMQRQFLGSGRLSDYGDPADLVSGYGSFDSGGAVEEFYGEPVDGGNLEALSDAVLVAHDAYYDNKVGAKGEALSLNYEQAKRMVGIAHMRPHPKGGKAIHLFYLGDHDPSGIDMDRDALERIMLLAGVPVKVHRIALNMDQVRAYNPPPNPTKLTDSRAHGPAGYIAKHGYECWELDALTPQVLVSTIEGAVLPYRDEALYRQQLEKEEAYKVRLREIADDFAKSEEADGEESEDEEEE